MIELIIICLIVLIILLLIVLSPKDNILENKEMFKNISINFKNPICSCLNPTFSWTIHLDDENRPGLDVTCKSCNIMYRVPNDKFIANFTFENPYPRAPKPNKDSSKTSTNLDNVIYIKDK